MRKFIAGLAGLLIPLAVLAADAPKTTPVPPGTPVTITVTQATPAAPPASIILGARHGHVTPHRCGCAHTGGGNIDVAQPTPDVVVVTVTGAAVAAGSPAGAATASVDFDLDQCFEISFDKPELKAAKLTIEGRVIGLLRSNCHGAGAAEESGGCATVHCDPQEVLTVCVPAHSVAGGENLSLNDYEGPVGVPVLAGKYKLHVCWHIAATHAQAVLPCKPASAEFAPDPAIDPLWLDAKEPFHGAKKDSFGLQFTIKVAEDTNPPAAEPVKPPENGKEKLPTPKPDTKPDTKLDTKPDLFKPDLFKPSSYRR